MRQIIEYNNAPDAYIHPLGSDEYGLFASRNMYKGDIIIKFDNPNLWKERVYHDLTNEEKNNRRVIKLNAGKCLVSTMCTTFSYINHAEQPSAYFDLTTRQIIALKDIKKDEEITLDFEAAL
jgi:hypothetical protein